MSAVVAVACARSDLGRSGLPAGVRLVEVPCTGRVTVPLLLAALCRGHDGVVVVGRHQQTCRLNGGEDSARDRCDRADRLCALVGLGAGRIRFVEPAPGAQGPLHAVLQAEAAIAALGPVPLDARAPREGLVRDGLDTALSLLAWLARAPRVHCDAAPYLVARALPLPSPGHPVLFAGVLPYLDVLASDLWAPVHLPAVLGQALALLGPSAGVAVGGLRHVSAELGRVLASASSVITLSAQDEEELASAGIASVRLGSHLEQLASALPRSAGTPIVAGDGSGETRRIVEALGHRLVDVGPDPLPSSFAITAAQRALAEARLHRAEAAGAQALLVDGAPSLARWALLTRRGSWRATRLQPLMLHQLAWLARSGRPLSIDTVADALYGTPSRRLRIGRAAS